VVNDFNEVVEYVGPEIGRQSDEADKPLKRQLEHDKKRLPGLHSKFEFLT